MADLRGRLTLYGYPTGNCLRTAIALEEAGLEYEAVLVDLRKGEQRSQNHLALNVAGKVPVLVEQSVEGTLVLTQSNAIALRADILAPDRIMPLEEGRRSVALERWFAFLTDAIAPNHAAFSLPGASCHEARMLLTRRAVAMIHRSEQWVQQSPFMAGEAFSLADIAGYTIAAAMGESVEWETRPALIDWFRRVGERPAVVRGMATFA